MQQIESKHNIVRYILAFGGVQGMNNAIGLIRNKLVALLLGPNGMGVMTLYVSTVTLLNNLTNLGLDKSGIQAISTAYETGDKKGLDEAIRLLRSLTLAAATLAFVTGIILSWGLSLLSFSSLDHTIHYIILSPAASLLIIIAGEMVVLKGTRQLHTIALLSFLNVIATLIVSVVLFYLWGSKAIIPSIILTALMQMIVTMGYSCRRYPFAVTLTHGMLSKGLPIIRLGVAFVIASTMTSMAEFLVRSLLYSNYGDTNLGLYNAGYTIAFTYGSMAFAAIDSEYFPRLSALCSNNDNKEISSTVLRQIKVLLAIITPMVIVLELLLPWIVPLLFSNKFDEAIPLAGIMLIAMVIRAVYLPIGYISLAKKDSKTFFWMDGLGAVFLLASSWVGMYVGGLTGCAIAYTVSALFDLINYTVICRVRYGLKLFF